MTIAKANLQYFENRYPVDVEMMPFHGRVATNGAARKHG
jgi:hypothetical protein